jgi:hypothetical protein
MPLLNFKPRFVAPIQTGIKHHTIRAHRIVPIKKGDPLYLYCGARHPGAFRILPEPHPCTRVELITISASGHIAVEGEQLSPTETQRLARADGFRDELDMLAYWKDRLPFEGNIIHWK